MAIYAPLVGKILAKLLRLSDCAPGFERTASLVLALAFLIVPFFAVELYPFSRFPMFRDKPRVLVLSRALDGRGAPVSLYQLGIIEVNVANPHPLLNLAPQRPLEAAHRFWTEDEFVPFIRVALAREHVIGPVTFTQELLGPVERDGRNTVDLIDRKTWEVSATGVRESSR